MISRGPSTRVARYSLRQSACHRRVREPWIAPIGTIPMPPTGNERSPVPLDRRSFGQNSFQLIRLGLAIGVLYRHSFDLLASGHADVLLDLIPPRTHLGRIALCFFMVVSGFLVTHSWL